MTKNERILALDAALVVCEGVVPRHLIKELDVWLIAQFEQNNWEKEADFGCFLDAQKEAVQKLAVSPEVFGSK